MPAGNRMQTSASLNTHSIWQNAIGYDPYAAESSGADTGVNQEAAQNARDNMKALLALANKNKGGAAVEDEKGGWKGRGTLRGGWAGGRDLGEVPKDALPSGPKASGASGAHDDDMPSSTSSLSDDDDDERSARPSGGGGAASSGAAGGERESKKRSRDEDERDERKRSRKEHKKKEKHKKEKHKKEKHKEKKHKKEKHRRRHSD